MSQVSKQVDLTINKLSKAKYQELKQSGQLCADQLYFIEQTELDAQNQRIISVAEPISATDAATKGYVDDKVYQALSSVSKISADLSQIENILSTLNDVGNIEEILTEING